jgi:hypothetical protein
MMDAELRHHARTAVDRLDHVLARGSAVTHDEIHAASLSVIAFRDRALERRREGAANDTCLARANALVSLAYGGEFPLSGLHRERFRQTRDGMRALLDQD